MRCARPDRLFGHGGLTVRHDAVLRQPPRLARRARQSGRLMKSRSAAQRPTAGRGFVAVQVALSLVLVAMAALLSTESAAPADENTGFALDQVTIQTAPLHLRTQTTEASSISTTA